MKIRLRFFGDPRNQEQKQAYQAIERARADAWLNMALVRRQRARLFGHTALLKRQAG